MLIQKSCESVNNYRKCFDMFIMIIKPHGVLKLSVPSFAPFYLFLPFAKAQEYLLNFGNQSQFIQFLYYVQQNPSPQKFIRSKKSLFISSRFGVLVKLFLTFLFPSCMTFPCLPSITVIYAIYIYIYTVFVCVIYAPAYFAHPNF